VALELKITKEPEDVSDGRNGDRLLATVEIFGADHHLELIRVVEDEEDGSQSPENLEYQGTYDDLQAVYSGTYQTFEIPGFTGRYIAFMTPYDE
jgi:hypothetical protein